MHTLLSLILTLLGAANAPDLPHNPAGGNPSPLTAVAYGDCLDFFLMLDDPAVQSTIVGCVDFGAFALVSVVHSGTKSSTATKSAGGAWSFAAVYTFPSTIYAHSVVQVPYHAAEME